MENNSNIVEIIGAFSLESTLLKLFIVEHGLSGELSEWLTEKMATIRYFDKLNLCGDDNGNKNN